MSDHTVTVVSSAEFSKDVDRYISDANTAHRVFEIAGPGQQSVVLLSKQDYAGWLKTILMNLEVDSKRIKELLDEHYRGLFGPTLREMVSQPGGDDIEFEPPRLPDDIFRFAD